MVFLNHPTVSRLVMQSWYEKYREILSCSKIEELLGGIYVDDGRCIVRKLKLGSRFVKEKNCFVIKEKDRELDEMEGITRESLTEREFRAMMNSINEDIEFTTETFQHFNTSTI